ncbi:MAG: asparagine synthase-related protein, partial [Gammaproteobacteria bacterium]
IMPLTLGRLLCATLGHLPSRGDYMNWPFLLRQLSQGLGRPAHAQSLYWMAPMVPTFEHPLINGALGAAHAERNAIFDELAVKMDHLFRRSSACLAGMQRFFIENYLPYDILYKTDRASMYNGLEVRSPFLDLDLFSLIRRSSHFLSPRARIGKLDLKSVLRNYLPAPLVERKKHGFALPVSRMLCHEFRPFLETYLMANDNPMYQVFEKSAVQRVWQQHLSGRCDRGKLLWMLFWLAVFLKRNA